MKHVTKRGLAVALALGGLLVSSVSAAQAAGTAVNPRGQSITIAASTFVFHPMPWFGSYTCTASGGAGDNIAWRSLTGPVTFAGNLRPSMSCATPSLASMTTSGTWTMSVLGDAGGADTATISIPTGGLRIDIPDCGYEVNTAPVTIAGNWVDGTVAPAVESKFQLGGVGVAVQYTRKASYTPPTCDALGTNGPRTMSFASGTSWTVRNATNPAVPLVVTAP